MTDKTITGRTLSEPEWQDFFWRVRSRASVVGYVGVDFAAEEARLIAGSMRDVPPTCGDCHACYWYPSAEAYVCRLMHYATLDPVGVGNPPPERCPLGYGWADKVRIR